MVFHQRGSRNARFLTVFWILRKSGKIPSYLLWFLVYRLIISDILVKRLNILAIKMDVSDNVMEKWEFVCW